MNLNTSDIGYQSRSRIYLNESLTQLNRSIFQSATAAKKSQQIFKAYTRNGIVHVQLSQAGKIFRVNSINQLNSIIAPQASKTSRSSPNSSQATTQNVNGQSQQAKSPDITQTVHGGEPMEIRTVS